MLLRHRLPVFGILSRSAARKRAVRSLVQPPRESGTEHPCGLRHRFSYEFWSWTTAIMWWALRNDR